MKAKQTALIQFISFFILVIGFIVIRYVLFNAHGMKQWPFILFWGCFAVLVICFFVKLKITSLAISMAYMVGFVLGKFLQTNSMDAGGGATNNMWIIWTITIVIITVISGITEYLKKRVSTN